MKYVIVMLAAFALLLAGCASAPEQQAAAPPAPATVPPAPGNDATPTMPPGAQLPPAAGEQTQQEAQTPCGMGMSMMQGRCMAGISLSQLAAHNTEADCWVGYNEQVYDITAFIPNHKNYQALIVPLCGTADEFKEKFEGKHGLSKVSVLENQTLVGYLGQ